MMIRFNRKIAVPTAVVLGIVFVAAVLLLSSSAAKAKPNLLSYWQCTPDYVAAFSNRVHAHCAAPYVYNTQNIYWFAVCSTGSGSPFASRALSIFTTAKVTGKTLRVYFEPTDTSGTNCGCDSNNCRAISGAEVLP
jgi:hypothetical protein